MTELQNETIAGDRGITPVGGGDNGRAAMLKRGFGALALIAFAFLIIWGTWKGDKPVSNSTRKLVIRQAAAFEPIPELPPAPVTTASIGAAPVAATPAALVFLHSDFDGLGVAVRLAPAGPWDQRGPR